MPIRLPDQPTAISLQRAKNHRISHQKYLFHDPKKPKVPDNSSTFDRLPSPMPVRSSLPDQKDGGRRSNSATARSLLQATRCICTSGFCRTG